MIDFLKLIFSGGDTIYILIPVVLASSLFFYIIYTWERYSRTRGAEKFYKLLTLKFSKGLIKDKEDILLLLNSVCRESEKEYSLAPILEDYLSYLTDKEKEEDGVLKTNYELLKEIIKIESAEKPFANIPEEERRLLRNIDDSVKHNDIVSIKYNLQELNSVISTRNRIYQKANKINRWSIPIAIIGIILTIIFGLISLQSIDYNKIESINKKLTEQSIGKQQDE